MTAAVEDRAAVGADEVCEARSLSALLAQRAVAERPDARRALRLRKDPRADLKRRAVTDMLVVPAVELGDPLAVRVLMEAADGPLHV